MKIRINKKYVIMISLILLMIVGLVVLNTTGVLKKIGKSAEQITEAEAQEKLEQALQTASTQKETDANYNSSEYLTNLLQEQNIIVIENIVAIDGYNFEIDRETLQVTENLGKSQVEVNTEVVEVLGKNDNGKYRAKVQVTVTSNIPIDNMIFQNENGTYTKETTEELTYTKEMEIELDKEYVLTIATKDGKLNTSKVSESSDGIFIPLEPECYGDYVDYDIDIDGDGNTTNDWMIFYQETDGTSANYGATYIIPDYYVPYSKMTTSISNAGMSLYSGTYRVRWSSVPSYKTILDGTDSTKPNVKSIFMYDYTGTSNDNVKAVSRLLDVDAWKDNFVTSDLQAKGGMAIGGPTINMWCASWNKAYPTEKVNPTISGTGYQVNGSSLLSLSNYTGYKTDAPNVYFPIKSTDSDGTYGYWLASPSSSSFNYLVGVRYSGYVDNGIFSRGSLGVRPLVYLPSSVQLIPTETPNVCDLNYGK